jgi:membrane protease YdiL (CAAX protease family)
MLLRATTFGVGLVLLLSALSLATLRVAELERRELEHETPWASLAELEQRAGATRISARLGEVALSAGEQASLELCAQSALTAARFENAFDVVVWRPSVQKVELRVPLDAAHLALEKRGQRHSCLALGGGRVSEEGKYVIDAVWKSRPDAAVMAVPLRARVLARTPLGLNEGLLVLLASFGAMLCVLSAFAPRIGTLQVGRHAAPRVVAATLVALALSALVMRLPIPGSVGGMLRGLLLATVEIAIAWLAAAWIFGATRPGLALHAPAHRPGLWLLVSVGCAALLNPMARLALRLVPQTGQAPIETFIAWPSGALAFAALGMAVPLAEELFFRGLVYGALEPRGRAIAYFGTLALFTAAHAQQAFGNWGALLAVTITGAVLTGLRAVTGSTLVPAVAHLLYNLSLWRDSFSG